MPSSGDRGGGSRRCGISRLRSGTLVAAFLVLSRAASAAEPSVQETGEWLAGKLALYASSNPMNGHLLVFPTSVATDGCTWVFSGKYTQTHRSWSDSWDLTTTRSTTVSLASVDPLSVHVEVGIGGDATLVAVRLATHDRSQPFPWKEHWIKIGERANKAFHEEGDAEGVDGPEFIVVATNRRDIADRVVNAVRAAARECGAGEVF